MRIVCYSLIHAKLRQFQGKLAGGPGWIRSPSPAQVLLIVFNQLRRQCGLTRPLHNTCMTDKRSTRKKFGFAESCNAGYVEFEQQDARKGVVTPQADAKGSPRLGKPAPQNPTRLLLLEPSHPGTKICGVDICISEGGYARFLMVFVRRNSQQFLAVSFASGKWGIGPESMRGYGE
jgi:hypothetical protein